MAGNPQSTDQNLRETLVAKIEQKRTHLAVIEDEKIYLHFSLLLQDLPFDGQPSLLADEHHAAIAALVDRASRKDVKIFKITGHTSQPGTDEYNLNLSRDRAQAVRTYLQQQVDAHPDINGDTLYNGVTVAWRGEQETAAPSGTENDNPLDRRVKIRYRIKILIPKPADANVPRSRFWKVDFAAGGNTFGFEAGVGSLTMLPDTEIGQTEQIQKTLVYESMGISVGLAAMLKKLKFVTKFPLIQRLLKALDSDIPGSSNYKNTAKILKNTGFSADIKSEGGHFYIDEPLSFEEMKTFNFACVAGNVSLFASGSGQLIMLHSPNFFASTVIYGGGITIAFPDAGLNFVPIALVDVNL